MLYNPCMTSAKKSLQRNDRLNLPLSKRAAKIVNAVPKACWQNAYRALLHVPELASGYYVEGWYVSHGIYIAFEHAWIELDGHIIDPTPISWKRHHAYFPGLRFTKDDLRREVQTATELPIAWRYGVEGIQSPAYRKAWKQAFFFGIPEEEAAKFLKEDVSR
jgi:hypothetical protein